MIQTSQAFKTLMNSSVRPKCEPFIRVYGKDNTGTTTELTWNASNITELTYKRGIDPAGRTLPFMELTWKEVFSGKLDKTAQPEKYNNITKYMNVELSFNQYLSLGGSTYETVTMPKLYLNCTPIVEGQFITWHASDLLSFLTNTQTRRFAPSIMTKPFAVMLLDGREGLYSAENLIKDITDTAKYYLDHPFANYNTLKPIIADGATNSLLMNFLSLGNLYLNYSADRLTVNRYVDSVLSPVFNYTGNILRDFPKVTQCPNISVYKFKFYDANPNVNDDYRVDGEAITIGDKDYKLFRFDGYGQVASYDTQNIIAQALNFAISSNANSIDVVRIPHSACDDSYTENTFGEVYEEDNPLNPYSSSDPLEIAETRFTALKKYFNEDSASLEFSALSNVSLEAGDVVTVDTNLYDNGVRVRKNAIIVQLELNYNGALKESFIAHEVKYDN